MMLLTAPAFSSYVLAPSARTRASVPMMSLSGEEELLSKFGVPAPEEFKTTRREALGLGATLGVAATMPFLGAAPAVADDGMFSVPPLPYAYDALEPTIDAATMKFHHDFHHQAYVNNLNKAMAGKPAASLASLMPGAKGAKLNNAGGGHYNHCMFWTIMGPGKGGAPSGDLAAKINDKFGDFDSFKEAWSAAAAGVFGSGWAWLVVNKDGSVDIVTSPNQDNPLMDGNGQIPIMGIDVWEHAYYLKYQNRRPEYIKAWFDVVDWGKVGEYYATAKGGKAIEF